jgi:glycosyltransferase involved in cell wall biosynthesis
LFYLLGSAALWRHVRRGDVVVAKTDPPLIAVGAALVARIRGASLVNWLQDIYPEVAIRLGVPGVRGPLGALLAKLRNLALKSAVINVAIGERMREFIADRGVDGATIRVIANWVDDQAITPIPRADNPLRASLGLQDHFVVGYSGNLGRAHEFETLLGAAHLLRAETRLAFLFFGGGFHMDALKARVRDQGLSELFMFQPSQPLSDLSNSLSLPDVHWLSLRPQLEGLIVPSKFYGIAAAGRPVLSITAEDGEIARIVQEAECGVVVEPGRSSALAAAIQRLRADRPRCDEMGRNARALIDARFSRRQTLESWSKLLRDV